MKHYYNKKQGFTIVELLIVVVIIAILAAITIVSYNGIQTRSQNAAALTELRSYQKIFESYKSQNGSFPSMADGGYCLGSGFPIGGGGVARCRDYQQTDPSFSYPESGNTALMSALATTGKVSQSNKFIFGATVGPYVVYTTTDVKVFNVFKNITVCPGALNLEYDNGAGLLLCSAIMPK